MTERERDDGALRDAHRDARYRIDVFRHVPAPIDTVWEIISNHRGYASWTPMTTARLEVEGSPQPDGVGAVRFLGVGPVGARERVLEFDPPDHLAYTIVSGPPARGYRADMWLQSTSDGGTDLRWLGSFASAPRGLGGPTRAMLAVALRDLADRVVREGARRGS